MPSLSEPYVGPRAFEEGDRGLFFGREQEADELVSLITAHRIVLLYAQSGAGKTSLVKAGLIPVLAHEEKFDVLPPLRVRGQIAFGDTSRRPRNIYVFNALLGLGNANGSPPLSDCNSIAQMSLTEFLRQRKQVAESTGSVPSIIIFDQLEEIFTLYPERWEERQEFFNQLGEALSDDPMLRVLLSMREDFIAELDPYVSCLPEKLRTRFRIERLNRHTALSTVVRPLEAVAPVSGGIRFEPGAAEELIDNLLTIKIRTPEGVQLVKGQFVEPLQLQVVCQTLWRNLKRGDTVITREHLKAFGDVDLALSIFYENAVQATVEKTGIKAGVLRGWSERNLITPAGTRGTVFRGETETAGLANNAVDELERQHLIRMELRGGAPWYELAHDRFVEIVKKSNQTWLLSRPAAEQILLRLESKAADWDQHDRQDASLLDEVELLEAERWLDNPGGELEPSRTLIAFVRHSREVVMEKRRREAEEQQTIEQQARQAKRFKRLSYALSFVCVLAGIATVLALLYWLQARSLIMRSKLSDEKLISQKAELEDNQQKLEALKKEREITNGLNQSIIQAQEDLYTLKLDKAKEEYNSLLQQFGENNTAKAVVYSNLGEVYFQNSQPPEALDAYNSALSIWKEGKNAAFIYNEQAEVYMDWADQTANSTRAAQYYVWAKTLYNKAQRSAKAGTPIYRAAIRGAKEAGDKANPSANPFAQTNPQ